jgi:hypothetical protein
MSNVAELRLQDILGRQLLSANNQPVGRIEEFRARSTADGYAVIEVVIGVRGLLERMNVGVRRVVGAELKRSRVARWDQIDFSNPSKPKLRVSVNELVKR